LSTTGQRCLRPSVPDVAERINDYQRRFEDARPTDGDDATYKSIFVVFTDLSADVAGEFFDKLLEQIAVPSYAHDGFVMGGFYEGNEATAIYNTSLRPFTSPVPCLLIRHAVVDDWKFFLDNDDWLGLWSSRYRDSGALALAEQLRHLPWRAAGDE